MVGFGWGSNADVFYPEDLLNEYKSIDVDGIGTISVNKYRCANPKNGGTVDAESIKDGFIGASGAKILAESGGAVPYVAAFTGKASPAGIGRVLGCVYKYKDAFIKMYGKAQGYRGDCAKLLAAHANNPEKMLQAFTDKYIGLDCNGFVGNYASRVKKNALGPQHSPKQFYEQRKASRTTIDDAVGFDVIIWADYSHIAIIDSFVDLKTVNIVQSTGGGPQMTAHRLVSAGKGLFLISPPTKVGGNVRVIDSGF